MLGKCNILADSTMQDEKCCPLGVYTQEDAGTKHVRQVINFLLVLSNCLRGTHIFHLSFLFINLLNDVLKKSYFMKISSVRRFIVNLTIHKLKGNFPVFNEQETSTSKIRRMSYLRRCNIRTYHLPSLFLSTA